MSKRPFLCDRIYAAIKLGGKVRLRDVVAMTGLDYLSTSQMMLKMKRNGILTVTGKTHSAYWSVSGPPPKDMRGKAEGCAKGREMGTARWRDNLAKAALARGRNPDAYICRPVPGCELERCWGVPDLLQHWKKHAA